MTETPPSPAPNETPSPARALKPVRVAWVAGPRTLEEYGDILAPLAVGLLDELVELLVLCPQGADVERLPSPPVRTVRYARPPRWAFWGAASADLPVRLAEAGIRVLHALDAGAVPLARRLSRATAMPYAASCFDLRDGRALWRHGPGPACVLAASESVRQELARRGAVNKSCLLLLRPGVHQVRRASCFTRPQYSVTIVAGGRLDDAAAGQAVVRAFAEVAKARPGCAFFVLGGGRAEPALRRLAEKSGLRTDLAFADWGGHRQLGEVFRSADLYVNVSERRDVDVRCLLAMASGVPVLTPGAGANDFLLDGRTAAFFRRGDARDLAGRLIGFLEDRAAARALADGALEYLREHHSPPRIVAELARRYRELA